MTSRFFTVAGSVCSKVFLPACVAWLGLYLPASAQRVEYGLYSSSFSDIELRCDGWAQGYWMAWCVGRYPPYSNFLAAPDAGYLEGQINWGPQPVTYFNNQRGELVVEQYMMHGYWHEDASAVECEVLKHNTLYWGWVIFQFDQNITGWSGIWGYCENPEVAGEWNGGLIDDLQRDWR